MTRQIFLFKNHAENEGGRLPIFFFKKALYEA